MLSLARGVLRPRVSVEMKRCSTSANSRLVYCCGPLSVVTAMVLRRGDHAIGESFDRLDCGAGSHASGDGAGDVDERERGAVVGEVAAK